MRPLRLESAVQHFRETSNRRESRRVVETRAKRVENFFQLFSQKGAKAGRDRDLIDIAQLRKLDPYR